MSTTPLTGPNIVPGPLVVSTVNPRYFSVASGQSQRAVYLTGSHIWNNFHDGLGPGASCADTPEENDYPAYLDFLRCHGHNFIRLWRWEQFRSQAAGGGFHLCMTPQPWPRTGPGTATDGKPRFDLDRFDPVYFQRLRERIMAAGNAGIYVAVMFFDGFGLHLCPAPDNVEGHPFFAANNVNQVGISSIVDYQVLPLHPLVEALQETYLRHVIDTVHDLPNVLYEVANESSGGGQLNERMAAALRLFDPAQRETVPDMGDSTIWQYWIIDFVRAYERQMGYDPRPIGMTMQYPVADQTKVNKPLFHSRADWISPGYDDPIFAGGGHPGTHGSPDSNWYIDPPANDGRKVILTDTDHYASGKGDALWAWKSFLRGHNPILMDFGLIDVARPLDPSLGVPSYESFEPARLAMGDTRRYAERIDLLNMVPRNDLTSTGYALARPDNEYLILEPDETAASFTVTITSGTYSVEWYSVTSRQTVRVDPVSLESAGTCRFRSPFVAVGPSVLYLKKSGQ
ncbi:MAG: hypothetical protein H7Z72_01655 [Bacteroidetes bacterium]|nr:hypothetical protein [Fibrella sp.]